MLTLDMPCCGIGNPNVIRAEALLGRLEMEHLICMLKQVLSFIDLTLVLLYTVYSFQL